MHTVVERQPLVAKIENSDAGRLVGVIGPVGRDLDAAAQLLAVFAEFGIRNVVSLGGLPLKRDDATGRLRLSERLSRILGQHHQLLLFVDGPSDPDGLWQVAGESLDGEVFAQLVAGRGMYLPRGFRGVLGEHVAYAAFGGGEDSGDEARTTDVKRLGGTDKGRVDVLFSHLPPLRIPGIVDPEPRPVSFRRTVHTAFVNTMPRIAFAAGNELVIRTLGYRTPVGPDFVSRVVVLPPVNGGVVAILDTEDLTVTPIAIDGTPVDLPTEILSLDGVQSGRWVVHTQDSDHVFDLDRRTWERQPGRNTSLFRGQNAGRLRTLEGAMVGENMFITTYADDYMIDYWWAHSSVVHHIERLDDDGR